MWYEQADRAEPLNPCPVASLVLCLRGERSSAGWQAHQAAAPQVSKLQQDGLDMSQLVGVATAQHGNIWSPYGPYSQPRTGPFTHLPTAQPPTPYTRRSQKGTVAPGWLMGDRAADTWPLPMSTHHLAQRSPHNPNLENGDKIILGHKGQSHRGSTGIWVTEMRSL